MRLNKYIALSTGLSRRAADDAVYRNRVLVNGRPPTSGQQVTDADVVTLDSQRITPPVNTITIMLNKPAGYVCSREGQGNKTVYELIPEEFHVLKSVGRLDKDSSGLLLMTNDGNLAQELTHPKYQKTKIYEVTLDKPLMPLHRQMITDHGISLADGRSKLQVDRLYDGDDTQWQITMHEGRNRQIRRTFEALGYNVVTLHRTNFGTYSLYDLGLGNYKQL
ncbi:MAG TPA: pseudouridine synthase [Candidatus Saccharimonadales bacterium]|jgi:23S rRNA pseudouridine2605 synthase